MVAQLLLQLDQTILPLACASVLHVHAPETAYAYAGGFTKAVFYSKW